MYINNPKANYLYFLYDQYETGIVLTGAEARAITRGGINFTTAHVRIKGNELYLVGAQVSATGIQGIDLSRTRKLLMHRNEINNLIIRTKQKSLTLVPVAVYTKGRKIKVKIALAKPKRTFEKREAIKKRDLERRGDD